MRRLSALSRTKCASTVVARPAGARAGRVGRSRLRADGDGSGHGTTGTRRRGRPRLRSRRTPSRRPPPSTSRDFRFRIVRATPMVARARRVRSARMPCASAPTATTAPAGPTASRCAGRSEARRGACRRAVDDLAAPRDEAVPLASRRAARPRCARADLGRSGSAQTLPAARLDGRGGVVPVSRRRVRARVVRDRAGPPRLREERVAAAGILVRGLRRRSRSPGGRVRTRRVGRSRRAQPGRQCRDALCRRPSGASAPRDFARRFRDPRGGIGRGTGEDSRSGSTRFSSKRASRRTRASMPSRTGCRRAIRGCRATRRCFSPRIGRRSCRTGGFASPPIRATGCPFRRCTGSRKRTRSGATSRRRRCGSPPRTRTSRSGWTIIRKAKAPPTRSPPSAAASRTFRAGRW